MTSAAAGGGVIGVQWTQIGPAPLIDAEQNYQGAGPRRRSGRQHRDRSAEHDRQGHLRGLQRRRRLEDDRRRRQRGRRRRTTCRRSRSERSRSTRPTRRSFTRAPATSTTTASSRGSASTARSTPADTWSLVDGSGALDGSRGYDGLGVNFIVMPAADTLLVATNQGLFRSTNAGGIFTQVSCRRHQRRVHHRPRPRHAEPEHHVYAAVSGAGHLRLDGRRADVPGAEQPLGRNHTGAPSAAGYGFLSFAQSTTVGGQTMYADAQSTAACTPPGCTPPKNFGGMFKSTDGGATWSNITAAANSGGQLDGCQCGYDQTIGVDPVDENKVYIGFQELWYSSDGGGSFANISDGDIHWDHHAIVFSPPGHRTSGDDTTRVWIGTDGGNHYTDDAGGSFVQRNGAIATNLFRAIDIGRGAGNNGYSYGGAQDTGTMRHKPTDGGTELARVGRRRRRADGRRLAEPGQRVRHLQRPVHPHDERRRQLDPAGLRRYQLHADVGRGGCRPERRPARLRPDEQRHAESRDGPALLAEPGQRGHLPQQGRWRRASRTDNSSPRRRRPVHRNYADRLEPRLGLAEQRQARRQHELPGDDADLHAEDGARERSGNGPPRSRSIPRTRIALSSVYAGFSSTRPAERSRSTSS